MVAIILHVSKLCTLTQKNIYIYALIDSQKKKNYTLINNFLLN